MESVAEPHGLKGEDDIAPADGQLETRGAEPTLKRQRVPPKEGGNALRIRVSALVILFSLCLLVTNPAEPSGPQSETAEPPTWSLAATGDSIITRPISIYDDELLLDLVELVRGADIAFTNVETTIFRLWDFKGWPAAGAWEQRGPAEMADELKWMGSTWRISPTTTPATTGSQGWSRRCAISSVPGWCTREPA